MNVIVKTLNGQQENIETDPDEFVRDFKTSVSNMIEQDVGSLKLIFKDEILDDSKQMKDYNINENDIIQIAIQQVVDVKFTFPVNQQQTFDGKASTTIKVPKGTMSVDKVIDEVKRQNEFADNLKLVICLKKSPLTNDKTVEIKENLSFFAYDSANDQAPYYYNNAFYAFPQSMNAKQLLNELNAQGSIKNLGKSGTLSQLSPFSEIVVVPPSSCLLL